MHFSEIYDEDATEIYIASFKKDEVEVVSFDFFDTLVFRKSISHYGMWKDQSQTFFWLRSCAEIISRIKNRVKGIPEVTSAEIYSIFLKEFGFTDEFEFEMEKINLVANSDTVSFLKTLLENNIKVCIISDTHYTHSQIENFLSYLEIPVVPVYTSEKFLLTKSTGLFEKVSDSLSVPYVRWVHIGDNPKSDIESANSFGISTLRYQGLREQLVGSGVLSANAVKFLISSGAQGRAALSTIFQIYLDRPVSSTDIRSRVARLYGSLIGNVVGVSIANQIHVAVTTENYDLVLYSSRDGWLPYLNHKRDFPNDPVIYFKTSREMLRDPSYLKYVKELLGSKKKILIFDLGWRGTTLRYLEDNFPDVSFTGFYWQLLGRQKNNQIQLNPGNLRNRTRMWRSRDLIETLFTDESNGYDSIGPDLVPIERQLKEDYSKKKDFLAGAIMHLERVPRNHSTEISSLIMEALVRYPSFLMISIFSDVTHTINSKSRGRLTTDSWRSLLSRSPILWSFGSGLVKPSSHPEKLVFRVVMLAKEIFQRSRYLGGRLLKRISSS